MKPVFFSHTYENFACVVYLSYVVFPYSLETRYLILLVDIYPILKIFLFYKFHDFMFYIYSVKFYAILGI